jgi:NhaA family Na+:H+ antiporter
VLGSILMIAGTVIALVWANVNPAGYEAATHPLHFAVNDIAMVFFFGMAMKEIVEATAPGGALHSFRRAAVPVIAAIGGMAGPALLYALAATTFGYPELMRGWAIPVATDIAFSYLVAHFVFGPKHPAVPFLLLLAIADDAFGLIILAIFYPSGVVRPVACLVLVGAACVLTWVMRRQRVRSFWPYILVPGALSWAGLYLGGLHPALALVPVIPLMPHAKRDPGLFVEGDPPSRDPLTQFEHWWQRPVQIILFFFALVNAGVPIGSVGAGTWLVLGAILLGKPLGITLSSLAATAAGLRLPAGVTLRELVTLSVAAAIGFTVALFFATAAFPGGGRLLEEAKLGALLSLSAAVLTPMVAFLLRAGRFRRPSTGTP